MKDQILKELRQLITPRSQKELLNCSYLKAGIPQSGITSVVGPGKTEFALKVISENLDFNVAWLEENFSIYPYAFLQKKVDLNRVLFVEAGRDFNWVTMQILKAQVFRIVVAYGEEIDVRHLRRIQLACEKSHSAVIWLSNSDQSLWPVSLQLRTHKSSKGLEVEILKQRY